MSIILKNITQSNSCQILVLFIAFIILTTRLAHSAAPASMGNPIDNPYCQIPTFATSEFNGQARAIVMPDKSPAIVIDINNIRPPLARFLLAHECCHHSLGHINKMKNPSSTRNWRSLVYRNEKFELDADCCAATLLRKNNDMSGLESAISLMKDFGHNLTGFGYPRGSDRAQTISRCSTPEIQTPKGLFTENR